MADRELTAEERDRATAEAEKFRAEAAKARAETSRADAQAARERTEELKVASEVKSLEAVAGMNKIALAQAQRNEKDNLAADRYHHIYYYSDEVTGRSVRACMQTLSTWRRQDPGCDIEIVFSSPGGAVIDGLALYDFIQETRRDGHKITTSTIGYAASMAGILLQAGDKRVMGKEAYILIHELSFGAGGKIGEVEDEVKFIKKIQERVIDIFAVRCARAGEAGTAEKPLSKAQLRKGWERKDWWVDSDEALKLGLVDEIR